MKSYEPKNRDKTRVKKKGGKRRAIKNQTKKRGKDNKTLSKKSEKGKRQ
jgi:hypothetical protein